MKCLKLQIILVLALITSMNMSAQQATIKEECISLRTYPFDDPSPVARMNNIYPYFRFDGFSSKAANKEWKIITLENPFVKVLVAPEIGGKILGAIEKSTGKEFIYFNKVVKFRDIAMRGPWTSGGIEFNFGAIGHAPTVATPVDYLIRKNEDGSVSCCVGALDLPSRTEWRVEIKLEPDKAYFETNSFWHNPTEFKTSLYHWMNAAEDAGDDLQFFYPGRNHIDHGGNAYLWPKNEDGRVISFYKNNNYGDSHSYHVLGEYTDYFAGYWHDKNFGFGHWANHIDKPGKKIWIWALSRSGQIWEDLLTDTDLGNTQYVEIQSGLLLNQAGKDSTESPFKHKFFEPNTDQRFREIWFPVKEIGGIVDANPFGSLNVKIQRDKLIYGICANQFLNENLVIMCNGVERNKKKIELSPMNMFIDSLKIESDAKIKVVLGNELLKFENYSQDDKKLSRPIKINPEFDWGSVYGLFVSAEEKEKQRDDQGAFEDYQKCLAKDSLFVPALVGLSHQYLRRMNYREALDFAMRALSLDTYDVDANYVYGLIKKKTGKYYEAIDAFGFAARSMEYRSSAYLEIAEISFIQKDYQRAKEFALRSLDYNRYNINALKILALSERIYGNAAEHKETLDKILDIDPLNHFAKLKTFMLSSESNAFSEFRKIIKNELPHESYLELGIYCCNLGLLDEAKQIFLNSPSNPIVKYWLAYLFRDDNKFLSEKYLNEALEADPFLVYPSRQETYEALRWAENKTHHWKNKYYTGLLLWHLDRDDEAKECFASCGEQPDYWPFYLTRSILFKNDKNYNSENDLKKALELGPDQWRCYKMLNDYYIEHNQYKKAMGIISKGYKKYPDHYMIKFDYARALLFNNQFKECTSILESINILPYEGAGYGHDTYQEAYLMRALDEFKNKNYKKSIEMVNTSQRWPENLGVGKPYDVDERIGNYLLAKSYEKLNEKEKSDQYLNDIIHYTKSRLNGWNSNIYIAIRALINLKRIDEAKYVLEEWKKRSQDSIIINWASDDFEGKQNIDAQKLFAVKDETGTPWNPIINDKDFKLVYEVISGTK